MKNALLAGLQFLLFLITYAVATFALPLHRESVLVHTGLLTRLFVWDGLLISCVLLVLILLVEASIRRLRSAAPWTVLAYLLAILCAYAARLGFVTREF